MKAVAVSTALGFAVLTMAAPAASQQYGYQGQSRSWSSQGGYGHGYDFNGQDDRAGDYRCDAYWDRGRDDCGAAWRDQRPAGRQTYGHGRGTGRYTSHGGGGYVYQPYNQGTQYYGAYGRPDQVYPGSGYGGRAIGHRDTGRSEYCASRYRSYDPVSGYYRGYSGRLVFCG
jgi:hypothetical protein